MAKDTKERIIQESIRLFYELGYQKTTMRKIAGASGIAHPSIFKHFKSKAHIAEILRCRYIRSLMDLTRTYVQKNRINVHKSHDALLFYWAAHFYFVQKEGKYFTFFIEYYSAQAIQQITRDDFDVQVFRQLTHWLPDAEDKIFRLHFKLLDSAIFIITLSVFKEELSVARAVLELVRILKTITGVRIDLPDEGIIGFVEALDTETHLNYNLLEEILKPDPPGYLPGISLSL